MKKKILFTSILSAIIISSISVGAFAATKLETVSAYLNHGLNFKLSGKSWKPANEPITYDGSTYLPVRAVSEALGVDVGWDQDTQTVSLGESYDVTINFPADKFPQTAAHIASAIAVGKPNVCTIARSGADANRNQSLAGISTKDGYDRDEWPMAMCKEGGVNASVGYVESSDNRGSGSWVGNALTQYPDGTRVKFILTYGELNVDEPVKSPTTSTTPFASCAEAKSAGAAPLHIGDPGYSTKLDRDGDGVACE